MKDLSPLATGNHFQAEGRNFTAGEGLCHSDGKALAAWSSHKKELEDRHQG